jgi:hypothetical protein
MENALGVRAQLLGTAPAIGHTLRAVEQCLSTGVEIRQVRLEPDAPGLVDVQWSRAAQLWHHIDQDEEEWSLRCGVSEPSSDALTNIDLELTIKKDGVSANDASLVLLGSDEPAVLVHRGVFGSALGEVFLDYFRGLQLNVWDDESPKPTRAALIGAVGDALPSALRAFALEVKRLRTQVDAGRIVRARSAVTSFIDEPEEAQIDLLWEILLGQGALRLDDAVRFCAAELRTRGMVRYERLRRGGELYETLAALIQEAAAAGDTFDRPKRGYVRAVERDASAFTGDMWRACLLQVLTSEPVDRYEAMRAAAEGAVEWYGLEHQRLRTGGRVERGLRSAINSAVRRGLIERASGSQIRLAPRVRSASTPPGTTPPPSSRAPVALADRPSLEEADRPTPLSAMPDATPTVAEEAGPVLPVEAQSGALGLAVTLETPIEALAFPTRTLNWAERVGARTLRDLVAWHPDAFVQEKNIGRGSTRRTRSLIEDALGAEWETLWQELPGPKVQPEAELDSEGDDEDGTAPDADVAGVSFLTSLRDQLKSLDPIPRLIVSRRCGLSGEGETLQILGETLGITRERVRQLEVKVTSRLRKQAWAREVRGRLEQALASESSVALTTIERDPWWAGVAERASVLEYVVTRLLESELHVVEFDELSLLSRRSQEELEAAWRDIRAEAGTLPYPVHYDELSKLVARATDSLGAAVRDVFGTRLEEYLHFAEEGDRGWVVAFGKNKRAEVLAVLQERDSPIHVSELYGLLGRCHLPDEVLFFSRGVVGLRKHFPDFDAWQQRLVPQCIAIMAAGPPGRQWGIHDLHEELAELTEVPEWFGVWHLASLLRTSEQVDYLGRLRVQLPSETGDATRIHLADRVHDVVDAAGTPLTVAEIAEAVREVTDIRALTLRLLLLRSPFVRVDADRFGLLERDVPGGSEAIAEAVDLTLDLLEERSLAIPTHEALDAVAEASPRHRAWHVETLKSVLRNDPRVRLTRGGEVRLAAWDDQAEETATESVAPQPEPPAPTPAPVAAAGALDDATRARLFSRLPNEARPYFRRLLDEPPISVEQLLAGLDDHVHAFEIEVRTNEFADVALARELAEKSRALLAVPALSADQHRIVQAAIRYFVLSQDADDDFGIGGLDDDEAVVNAVMEYLGVGVIQ